MFVFFSPVTANAHSLCFFSRSSFHCRLSWSRYLLGQLPLSRNHQQQFLCQQQRSTKRRNSIRRKQQRRIPKATRWTWQQHQRPSTSTTNHTIHHTPVCCVRSHRRWLCPRWIRLGGLQRWCTVEYDYFGAGCGRQRQGQHIGGSEWRWWRWGAGNDSRWWCEAEYRSGQQFIGGGRQCATTTKE